MQQALAELVERAKAVLKRNWGGKYTIPSSTLYPHQWNWDSGFIAIGYSHYDQDRAQQELLSLFRGQWKNGMLPHILFNQKTKDYFPGPEFWQTEKVEQAPSRIKTSGITQPPIHATAALWIYRNAENRSKAIEFMKEIYPKILRFHDYLYTYRDPQNEGLVYIRHPWESGLDNSPAWDEPLARMEIQQDRIPAYERIDLSKVSSEERPTDEHYKKFVYLIKLFIEKLYDEEKIRGVCPFLIQDPMFNSILHRANIDLAKIGEILGEDTSTIDKWIRMTRESVNRKLLHSDHKIYDCYDLKAMKRIEVDTASGFLPLFAEIPSRSGAELLLEYLDSCAFCEAGEVTCYAVSNYNRDMPKFQPTNYWRGPIWININWMLYQGLKMYGYLQKAEQLRRTIVDLPSRYGFREYFDAIGGRGLGAKDFSWTAALFIDIVCEEDVSEESGYT